MSFIDFKEITEDSVGTTVRYGGRDVKELMQILNGKVVANRRPKILNEWIFVDHVDFQAPAGVPSAPTDSSTNRLYTDPSDAKLKVRKTGGTVVDLEGGGGAATLDDLTDVIITTPSTGNTIRYNGTNWVNAVLAFTDLSGTTNVVQTTTTQTLENKTIAAGDNTISGIVDANISAHTTTKITTTSKSLLNSAIAYTDQANVFGAFNQTFPTSRLLIGDSDASHAYLFAGSNLSANRTVTLPLLAGNDTFAMQAFTQTLTNKTVNTTDNTVTATSQATGDILKNNGTKFVRLARGTGLQVLRTNSGGTDVEWGSLDSERVGKSTASGNGSATQFNIAHGLGSTPTYAFISVAQSGSAFVGTQFTVDTTNIVVTFATAPASGTDNVIIYWRVVA